MKPAFIAKRHTRGPEKRNPAVLEQKDKTQMVPEVLRELPRIVERN